MHSPGSDKACRRTKGLRNPLSEASRRQRQEEREVSSQSRDLRIEDDTLHHHHCEDLLTFCTQTASTQLYRSIGTEKTAVPQSNSIQQKARRRLNPVPSPDHRRTQSSFNTLLPSQQQISRQGGWRGYTTLVMHWNKNMLSHA